MSMIQRLSSGFVAIALASAAQGGVLYSEGFENLSASGWTLTNLSAPAGQAWQQGDPSVFAAQAGPANSYAAASYLGAKDGAGTLSNWLISPQLALADGSSLGFFARGADVEGRFDTIKVYFSAGPGLDISGFQLLTSFLASLSGWEEFNLALPLASSGRIAFEYAGDAAFANYAGIDSVTIKGLPVSEPLGMSLTGVALLGLAVARRRQHLRQPTA